MNVRRNILLSLSLLIGVVLAAPKASTEEINLRPNVVIILADDLGIGDVSAYNENAAWETPNIDGLAKEGISFTDAHTSASICTPTRYGILTGRYNWRSRLKRGGLKGYSKPLIDRDRLTIARLFKENGYHTSFIGKWHVGWDWHFASLPDDFNKELKNPKIDFSQPIKNGPRDHGFIYSFALAASLSSPPYVYVENSQPTSIPQVTSVNYDEKAFWRKGPKGTDFNHIDVLSDLTNRSINSIRERTGSDRPFFLYLALTAPHAPIIPRTEFIGKSNTNAYGDFVLQVDSVVGQVIDALKENGLWKNTIVIFTSDNGQSPRADFDDDELTKADHNGSYIYRGKKFDIFEGGHRVPFIASWPDRIRKGITSDETISTVDLMATAAELVGTDLPDSAGEDSYSIMPVLLQEERTKPLREATVFHSSDGRFAIAKDGWKLILWPGSGGWSFPSSTDDLNGLPRFQLYNLVKDPSETNNLVAVHPQRVEELKSLLEKYIKNGRSTPGEPQNNDGPEKWPELEWIVTDNDV